MAGQRMKIGQLNLVCGVENIPFDDHGNSREQSSIRVNFDSVRVECSAYKESHPDDRTKMFVDVVVDGASVRIYRTDDSLTVICWEGEMKVSTGYQKPHVEISPFTPKP